MRLFIPLSLISLFLFFAAMLPALAADPPTVSKVEPPDWWIGHSVNPLLLLVRGTHLQNVAVRSDGAAITILKAESNAAGTYLRVTVQVAADAAPGAHPLTVRTAAGEAVIPFVLHPPLTVKATDSFTPDDVIYLILPDRFNDGNKSNNNPAKSPGLYDPTKTRSYHGGDFAGIRQKLPYLKALGVTALWLTPIYDNADIAHPTLVYDGQHNIDYHGYAAIDLYGVEEHFGTLSELREMVAAAHAVGIKVIQDQVPNHVGGFHPWVQDSPTPTWLNGTLANHLNCDWQVQNLMNPYAMAQTRQATLSGWFAGLLPDLNQDDPDMQTYLIQNSLWWVDTVGFDGIRLDTVPYVPRRFWQEWSRAIKRAHPRLTSLGEINLTDPALIAFFQGGHIGWDGIDTGIDTAFDYGLYGAMRDGFSRKSPSLRPIQNALAHDALYPHPELLVPFLSLHDVPCFSSLPFVTPASFRVALTFLLTVRGTPMLYYGDEIGLGGTDDPHNRRHFPGGFPSDTRDAFKQAGRTDEERRIFDHVQRLTMLRGKQTALRQGRMVILYQSESQMVYARVMDKANASAVITCLNVGEQPATLSVPLGDLEPGTKTIWHDLLGGANGTSENGTLTITLPAMVSAVLARMP